MNAKKYEVSKRAVILGFVSVMILFVIMLVLLFGFLARGKAISVAATKLEVCEKAAKKPVPAIVKRSTRTRPAIKTAKAAPAPKAAAPAPVLAMVPPAPAPAPVLTLPTFTPQKLYTLCIRVVEGSDLFESAPSMKSRDIGSLISKGLEEGQVKLTARPISFRLVWEGASSLAGKTIVINGKPVKLPNDFADGDGFEIMATNGKATIAVDPDLIASATALRVWPDAQMATPPNGLPLVVEPGVLLAQVKAGRPGSYLNFVL